MSMFHVYQLPVPLITSHDRSYFAVVEHSGKLICTAKKFDDLARSARLNPPNHGAGVTDPDERAKLRAELDAMVAHLYRLTEDEFAHILMTFPIVPEETKQAALDEFVRMRESGEGGDLAYRIILVTGLRRDELRQLRWSDVKLNAPMPFIQLRAETTKAKRADVLPVRADLAKLLTDSRGDAGDDERVCRSMPSMETHKRYLDKAGIAYLDDRGRRADFHALRHSYGSLLAKSGVAPRVAMALMRHSDMRLTMNVYTDPRIFDLAGAVEKLPSLPTDDKQAQTAKATGTEDATAAVGRSESVSGQQAGIGDCSAVTGGKRATGQSSLTVVTGGNRQQNTPSDRDGEKERVKGVEPRHFTLAIRA